MASFILCASARGIGTIQGPADRPGKRIESVEEKYCPVAEKQHPLISGGALEAKWVAVAGALAVSGTVVGNKVAKRQRERRVSQLIVQDRDLNQILVGIGEYDDVFNGQMAARAKLLQLAFESSPKKDEIESTKGDPSVKGKAVPNVILCTEEATFCSHPSTYVKERAERLEEGGSLAFLALALRDAPPAMRDDEKLKITFFRKTFGVSSLFFESEFVNASLVAGLRFVHTEDWSSDLSRYWASMGSKRPEYKFASDALRTGAIRLLALVCRRPTPEEAIQEQSLRDTYTCHS